MISAVLRVSSPDFDPNKFIRQINIDPDAVFENGFNMSFADSAQKDQFYKEFSESLKYYRNMFQELSKRGIESQIDIGVTVGTEDQYTCSIALPVNEMKELSEYSVQIVFSAYPASD